MALFALYAGIGRREGEGNAVGDIVVTEGRIRSLTETFGRQWGRPPSEDELAGLVRDFVREEALAREALALGLDRDDTIVRRRLAQKMEFLSDDVAAMAEPRDEDLRAFLAAHPERFRVASRFTFSQVFLDRGKRGTALEADAGKLLAVLRGGNAPRDAAALGDSRLLPAHQDDVPRQDVEAAFGGRFAARLEELPLDRWEGPIASDYGAHLVRVEGRAIGRMPPLDDVREAVTREWVAARREEMKAARLQALLSRYRVTIEASSNTPELPHVIAEANR
jgi:hypothetical protein